jgi:hypothetical protein
MLHRVDSNDGELVRRRSTPAKSSRRARLGLGLWSGTFIADRPQLDRTGSLAFLAPMALRTGQPLSRSAIVTNEDFFSHAKEVSTARDWVCQGLFFVFAQFGLGSK